MLYHHSQLEQVIDRKPHLMGQFNLVKNIVHHPVLCSEEIKDRSRLISPRSKNLLQLINVFLRAFQHNLTQLKMSLPGNFLTNN